MGENDIQSESGRFHGSAPVQRHCGLLGAWNRGSIRDDNAESVRGAIERAKRKRADKLFE